jgi:hypothetical protein
MLAKNSGGSNLTVKKFGGNNRARLAAFKAMTADCME